MSPGDLLLRWVSCHRELRALRVRAAAARLLERPAARRGDDSRGAQPARDAWRLLKNLVRLAHVEESSDDRLMTVPPTLVSLDGGRHLLVGARSEPMVERLAAASGVSARPPIAQPFGPAALIFEGEEGAIAAAAERLGIHRVRERGGELLASLPPWATSSPALPGKASPRGASDGSPRAPGDGPGGRATAPTDSRPACIGPRASLIIGISCPETTRRR